MSTCYVYVILTVGSVTSPKYPDNYPNNIQRTDKITVRKGWVILLEFTAFEVFYYDSHHACYDYLKIMDGDGTILLEKSCGTGSVVTGGIVHNYSLPPSITSSSNTVDIFFHTNNINTRSGWKISWQCRTRTGGECTGTPGMLLSTASVAIFTQRQKKIL